MRSNARHRGGPGDRRHSVRRPGVDQADAAVDAEPTEAIGPDPETIDAVDLHDDGAAVDQDQAIDETAADTVETVDDGTLIDEADLDDGDLDDLDTDIDADAEPLPVDGAAADDPDGTDGDPSLAALIFADGARRRPGAPPLIDLREAGERPAARAPLVVAVPPPRRRRAPIVVGAVLAAAALVGIGVVLGSRGDDADPVAAAATTAPEVLDATVAPTTATPTTAAATTTATTAAATTAAPTTTPATTAAPATTTAPATTAAPATTTPAPVPTPVTGDELPDLFTPVRWAIFKGGKVELFGRVPSTAVAEVIAGKAGAVVGPDNVTVSYVIDPTAPVPPSAPLYVRDTIQFAPGSAAVAPQFKPLLDLGVLLMQQNPGVKIWVMGRADNQGDPNANLFLSLARADAVIDYIASTGIDRSRLFAVPLGTDAALGDNSTDEGRQQNRSVEFVISGLLS